ncbi:hypothetical protein [Candidatus Uabimicrobium amorphum]|uniref:Uncharacterized protein n=1 Tax=Uabimicrobium amorphum TaxID=2596890 RepID=A0A5S9F4Z0_UABAM|nr:hypothetical protein [Candidatus Uabimicrobium amorphum]BBM86286.1 hypothetical protein UABAM_04672 [Candidatus Uabimicrobium amorphum]
MDKAEFKSLWSKIAENDLDTKAKSYKTYTMVLIILGALFLMAIFLKRPASSLTNFKTPS